MKLTWGLRWRIRSARTAVLVLLVTAAALLGGCWALAVPLIAAGSFGGGVAVAEATSSAKQHPSTPLAHQGGGSSSEAVAHPVQAQPGDESRLVMTDLSASTAPAIHSPITISAEGPVISPRRRSHPSGTHRDHGSGSSSLASTQPGALPATTIVH